MNSKPTILFVITQEIWGGAQRYVTDLVSNLDQEYNCVIAIGQANGSRDLTNHLQKNTCQIIYLKHLVRSISPWHDLSAVKELRDLYDTLKPDIVHLNSSKAGVIGSFAARLSKTKPKVVYTVHGWVFNEPLPSILRSFYKTFESVSTRYKDAFVLLSPQDNQQADKILKIPNHKRHVIPLDIIPSQAGDKIALRNNLIKKYHLPIDFLDHQFRIVTIANFFPTKGLDILLNSLKQIKDHGFDFRVVIIGEGQERPKLERQIEQLKLNNQVMLIGFVKDAAAYLPLFNLFVLPSRKEGLPYTILEAMAAQVPIIATAVGGVPNLIENGRTGLLIPSCQPQALAKAIETVINDHGLAEKMADAAKENTTKYSLVEMIEATRNLYQTLISSSSRQ